MVLGGLLGGDINIWQTVISLGMLFLFFIFFPRLILFQILYKIRSSLTELEQNSIEAENMFLSRVAGAPTQELKNELAPMKSLVVSPPADLDPAGMFQKLEHVLDSVEDKMTGFVDSLAPEEDEEDKADLAMAFKGVYGTHQIYIIIRHFKNLIEETKNYQIGGMIQMMLPVYRELSESQKDATKAFVNGIPIGDTIGPMVAASLIEEDVEEIAEDIVYSQEELEDNEYFVVKSKGPGARLGKYGDAIENIVSKEDITKIITVDAGMRFEGEETGTIVDGSGVLMGGPGVEKGKIEQIATDNDLPLEGFVIKQSGPEASKPMHRKIWDAREDVVELVRDEIRNTDGTVLIVGVGNTCGAGNSAETLEGLEDKLQPYWEKQEEESTSYLGLMKAFPMGNQHSISGTDAQNTFELFQNLVR